MARPAFHCCLPMVLATALLPAGAAAQESDQLTIYHCNDADGRPVIRDSPCATGQTQRRVTTMQRPAEPPPRPASPRSPPEPVQPAPAPDAPTGARTVIVRTPSPMYQCTSPDGNTYTSEDGSGNPRWVPLWTVGYGVYPHPGRQLPPPRVRPPVGAPVRPASTGSTGSTTGSGFRFDGVGRPSPRLPRDQPRQPPRTPPSGHGGRHPHAGIPYAAGGTWVQDSCRPLPQAEVCEILRDRSWTLRQRFNHALQSEQREITAERKRIAQRLGTDC